MRNDPARGDVDALDLHFEVDGARLLAGVGLRAAPGELISLIGPNGAGKSTLLRTLAGILRPTAGAVLLDGADLSRRSAGDIAKRLALLSQQTPDTFGFTALEVVLSGRYPHLGRFEIERQRDREIAADAMHRTETGEFAARPADTLSGGERQRVFIARALAQQPRVLLLDEPTASLDVRHQLATFGLMRDLAHQGGITVIAAAHDLRLAARYCDRLVLVRHGRIVADGPPEQVLTPAHLAEVFGVRASVYREPVSGALTVDFHDQADVQRPTRSVHVCGNVEAMPALLHALVIAGFEVTTDELPAGSLERFVADALGVPARTDAPPAAAVTIEAAPASYRLGGAGLEPSNARTVAEVLRRLGDPGHAQEPMCYPTDAETDTESRVREPRA